MIHVDPTPCGRWMFATSLQDVDERLTLLKATRTILPLPGELQNETLERLAEECIADLMGQMGQLGFSHDRIMRALDDAPESPLKRHRRA